MKVHGAALRRLAYLGARHGPAAWVARSPGPIGLLIAAALPEERRRIRRALELLRGPRGRLRAAREVAATFSTYAHCLAESLGADREDARRSPPVVTGEAGLREALSRGRGAVLLTAHTGAWDVAAAWLCRGAAAPVTIVMAGERDAAARAFQDRLRSARGARVVHVGAGALDGLPLLADLRRGGIVAVQLDRPGPGRVVEVPFGRGLLRVPEGPFRLAALTGAPCVTAFAARLGYFRHAIELGRPAELGRRSGPEEVRAVAGAAARELEAFLGRYPNQWFPFGDEGAMAIRPFGVG